MKTVSLKNGRYYYPLGSYSLLRVLTFERFEKYFREAPGGDLAVDYGAGDHPYEGMVRAKYRRYLAADHVATYRNFSEARTPDIVLNGGVLPLADASVDCITLTEVLQYLYDPTSVLLEFKRVLKPGGCLLGTVPFAIQHHDEPHDYHRYTYYSLRRMFVDAGFQIQNLDYVGDMVAVWTTLGVQILELMPKGLDKARLKPVGAALRKLFRLPLFAYYYASKAGLDPAKIKYFRRYPLGFSFYCISSDTVSEKK